MIKFDLKTFANEFINKDEYNKIYSRKEEILDKFNKEEMIGWTNDLPEGLIDKIKETAEKIKNNFLLVCNAFVTRVLLEYLHKVR